MFADWRTGSSFQSVFAVWLSRRKSPGGRLAKREECLLPREKPDLFAIPERERTVAIEPHFIESIANRQFPEAECHHWLNERKVTCCALIIPSILFPSRSRPGRSVPGIRGFGNGTRINNDDVYLGVFGIYFYASPDFRGGGDGSTDAFSRRSVATQSALIGLRAGNHPTGVWEDSMG